MRDIRSITLGWLNSSPFVSTGEPVIIQAQRRTVIASQVQRTDVLEANIRVITVEEDR